MFCVRIFLLILITLTTYEFVDCQTTAATTDENLSDVPYQHRWSLLEKKILTNYTRTIRPVKNDATKTVLKVLPFINHIEQLNEEEQTIAVHGYFYMEWYDEFLTWDFDDFGVEKINLWPGYVWTPDLMLYNSASGQEMGRSFGGYTEDLWIHYTGKITYFPTFSFKASCSFDYSDYPYDVQQCPLILGSWLYTLKDLDVAPLVKNHVQMSLVFNESKTIVSNWEVTEVKTNVRYWNAIKKERTDMKPSEPMFSFAELYVWINLKRYAPYFGAIVLMPCIMTSLITLSTFWMTSTTAGILTLLTNVIIQAVFTDDLIEKLPPSNGTVPRIVTYFALNLIFTVLSMIFLVIFRSIEEIKSENVPKLFRSFVYVRRSMIEKLNYKSKFSRQVNEDAEVENEETSSSAQVSTSGQQISIVIWMEVVDILKVVSFFVISIFYFISMMCLLTF